MCFKLEPVLMVDSVACESPLFKGMLVYVGSFFPPSWIFFALGAVTSFFYLSTHTPHEDIYIDIRLYSVQQYCSCCTTP